MRVYVPLTLPGLAEAHKAGELGPGPLIAYAVTPALREWYVSDDIEELEYAALNRAAPASLRLLAATRARRGAGSSSPSTSPDGAAVADPDRGLDRGALGEVRVAGAVPLAKAAAVHVDADDAEADVDGGGGRRWGRRTRATTTRSSPWTGPRTTSCCGSAIAGDPDDRLGSAELGCRSRRPRPSRRGIVDVMAGTFSYGEAHAHICLGLERHAVPRHRRGHRGDERRVRGDRPGADHAGAVPRAVLRAGAQVLRAAASGGCPRTPSGRSWTRSSTGTTRSTGSAAG